MKAKLIVNNETEVAIEDGIVAVGRASDNTIPIDYDSNVSRYHIEIETRGEEFWLVELGSSNGTTVNGEKIYDEKKLSDGDVILLGGTSEIIFETAKKTAEKSAAETAPPAPVSAPSVSAPAVSAAPAPPAATAAEIGKSSKMPLMLGVMGVVCGLAVVAVVIAVAVSFSGGGKCQAKAVITSPEKGDTIKKETDIAIESQNDDCVAQAVFYMDGKEFASTSDKPFKGSFDPSQFSETSDGYHSLRIALQDENGEKILQPDEVQLSFETLVETTPTPAPTAAPGDSPTPKPATGGKTASAVETQEMIRNLLSEFKGLPSYKIDPQFSQEVQKRTAEFSAEGYFARAQNYHEAIKAGYIQGVALDAPLGYILAMSRTQFKLPAGSAAAEEGLWRMNAPLVAANGYNGTCEGEALSDAKQNCAAKASALYMKALLVNVFDNDLVYAVAAFGMPTQDAAIWKGTLPANRADFWSVIKSPKQREEVVRFFAAGIVAENPQKFGLKKDAPISTLYKNYMVK